MDILTSLAPVIITQITNYLKTKSTSPGHDLAIVAATGDVDATEALLAKDLRMDRSQAIVAAATEGRIGVLEVLLEPPADKHAGHNHHHEPPKPPDLNAWVDKKTPLLAAVETGHKKTAVLLIKAGADPELAPKNTGFAALHFAAKNGDLPMVEVLINHGAYVDPRDNEDNTPLLHAARWGHAKTMTFLLDSGADIEARDNKGSTALLLASRHDSVEGVELLLERGANVRARDVKGRNALHRVIAGVDFIEGVGPKKKEILVKMLLNSGVDPKKRNKEGKTPADMAGLLRGGDRVRQLLDEGKVR